MSTQLTVADLKERLKERNLPTSGTKNELVRRLLEAGVPPEELYMAGPIQFESHEVFYELQQEAAYTQATVSPREIDLLQKERDLAVREVKLLKRELELLRMTPGSEENIHDRAGTRKWQDLKDLIGVFDGNNCDYDRWEKQARKLLSTYDLDEFKAKALICNRLTDKALKWYHSRVDCVELSCNDLLSELRKMYGFRPDQLALRREMEARVWRTDETFADYLYDKVTLANRVPVEDAEIISYVIEGIPSQELRTQAKVQCYKSVDAMLTAFAHISLPKGAHSKQALQRQEDHSVIKDKLQGKIQRKTEETNPLRCFNCNEVGHFASKCEKPKRERGSCFKCGKFGHQASQCSSSTDGVHWVTQGPQENDDFHRTIELRITNRNSNFSRKFNALLDTGSPICFVKECYISREYIISNKEHDKFFGINGSGMNILGYVEVLIFHDSGKYKLRIRVVSNDTMQNQIVLGRDFINQAKLTLGSREEISDILNIEAFEDNINMISRDMIINSDLPIEIQMHVRDLFKKHYAQAERPPVPAVENEMKLTILDNKPFSCTPRRLSYGEKAGLKVILNELLAKGIIRESTSEYASPVVLTKKKNGETRMCIDFRKLNKITARDNFPLSLIEDQLDLLAGKKYFTTLDLKDGFFHIKMHEESIKYTSFVTPLGQYEYVKMLFGLKGAPLKFQRYVTQIFKDLIDTGEISVYLDNFLIATETIEHHYYILEKVFKLLVANRLELRLDKCRFLQTKLDYLGYTVTSEGIRPTKQGIEAVIKYPAPRNIRDVQSFLGLCSYFRKFVEKFSVIAKPLYDLTKKGTDFRFTETEKQAFEMLKDRLMDTPILSIYSPHDETELHCDASAAGFGAILMQKKADRKFHPIFYFSKRTTEIESKYHSFELETLSIIYALHRFRTYLLGIKFKIITDCQALSLTLNKKETNPRIARWVLEMQNYDYILEHRSGSRMTHVDALSRQIFVVEDNSFDRNLALCQSDDPKIAKIQAELQRSENKLFEMRNGLIYRKRQGQILFYVPSMLESNIIYKYHNEMSHVGVEKTVRNILNSYWFPEIKAKVEKHIRSCLKCIAFTPSSGKPEGFLQNLPKGDKPFTTLHIDHLAPISRTHSQKRKYRYIFLVVDAFSKFVKLYAVKSTNASEVIKYLKSYFEHYSRPLCIISD